MNCRLTMGFTALAIAACLHSAATADQPPKRPEWDQEKALQNVKRVIELEKQSELVWDKIAWETDIEKAVTRSRKENKPLFVYMFLKKNVGPAAAPC